MVKPWWHILFISGIALFITLSVLLLFYPVPPPPVSEMKYALENLTLARENEADKYSGGLYREAWDYYDSAMANWRTENERFIYKRNYDKVAAFAELSSKKALQASETSLNNSANLKINQEENLKELENLIRKINNSFHAYPLTSEVRNNISIGKMLARESRVAFNERNYLLAEEGIAKSKLLLSSSYDYANAHLRSYFKSYPQWKMWIDSTIAASQENHDYSIIIDKFSHKFFVYLDGEIISEFIAELGENWIGDKKRRGDKATPEGMYKIVKKIEEDSTGYYKALLLDYPNAEDTVNFRREIEKGSLSSAARIGEKIEIHGEGGKGADWTSGCIALRNREIDSVFMYVRIGTPVTIVGSMYNLRQSLNR
jgi:hypothetical protein